MAHKFFEAKKPHNGLDYQNYMTRFKEIVNDTDESELTEEDKEIYGHTKMNLQRSLRIEKTYMPSEEIKNEITGISFPQLWMLITEAWCGDSAQNLPYLAKIASLNPLIDFRIIMRDDDTSIIDNYLTNGTRSIPILVAFDSDGNELLKWGPRPQEAVELVKNSKADGMPKEVFLEKLHLWYGRNRGAALEKEIIDLVSAK